MSSITIKSINGVSGMYVPKDVVKDMEGLEITLTTPQDFRCIGTERKGDIAELHGAYPVSLQAIFHALNVAKKKYSLHWWLSQFKCYDDTIILIADNLCDYNP